MVRTHYGYDARVSHRTNVLPTYNPSDRGGKVAYQSKVKVMEKYRVVGFISSGTYGRVYKAHGRQGQPGDFAIKKFKPDKEGEQIQYTGISQSAIREMALCSELRHDNVIRLIEIILEDKHSLHHHPAAAPQHTAQHGQEHHVPAAQRVSVSPYELGAAP
ncbi:hypothetical protein NPX13_g10297 [Xylaria arbuscula]|uniref:Serine/threonine-protein kinase SSN3 n=1 Tax=Xylaria arbuscula TaxID=114810 RepID=A0A9W8N510_9PEZI|nr:hypothetical protein NPX13_g10297 [Xylaria arbuscula]